MAKKELGPIHDVSELLWRLPGEGEEAYEAFRKYVDAGDRNGGKRSMSQVAQYLGKSQRLMEEWSRNYQWVERCRRWDNRLAAIETEERERIARERASQWEHRRQTLLDQSWEDSQLLREKVRGFITEGIPADPDDPCSPKTQIRWTGPAVVAALRLVVEAGAWSVKEALGDSDEDFDPLTATPEQLHAYLAKQGKLPGPAPISDSIDVTPQDSDE